MDAFLANITSFPTAIFTTLNIVVVGYWLLMIFGMFDMDGLDIDIDVDADNGDVSGFAGLLVSLGLTGAPMTIVITVITVLCFVICYYAVYIGLLVNAQTWLYALTGAGITLGSFFLSLPITAKIIQPIGKLFSRLDAQVCDKSLLGVTCTIRTSRVDTQFGEAECTIDGASLIIKVRSDNESFKHGDKAVIIEHDDANHIYHIVSEQQFNQ
jgi:hypothetical protein